MLDVRLLPALLRGDRFDLIRAGAAGLAAALMLAGCAGEEPSAPGPRPPEESPARGGDAEDPQPRPDRFPGPPSGATRSRVTDVTDGDTVSLRGLGKARLIGVDTPEVFGGEECFGPEASAFTKSRLDEGRVVDYRLGAEPRDRYGRALVYVWLGDERLFNGLLVERGFALPLAIPPNVGMARRFAAAARRARRADLGLWRRCDTRPGAGGGDRDCSDFATQAEAQAYFESKGGGPGRDVDDLDSDGDGRVCESLP